MHAHTLFLVVLICKFRRNRDVPFIALWHVVMSHCLKSVKRMDSNGFNMVVEYSNNGPTSPIFKPHILQTCVVTYLCIRMLSSQKNRLNY